MDREHLWDGVTLKGYKQRCDEWEPQAGGARGQDRGAAGGGELSRSRCLITLMVSTKEKLMADQLKLRV